MTQTILMLLLLLSIGVTVAMGGILVWFFRRLVRIERERWGVYAPQVPRMFRRLLKVDAPLETESHAT